MRHTTPHRKAETVQKDCPGCDTTMTVEIAGNTMPQRQYCNKCERYGPPEQNRGDPEPHTFICRCTGDCEWSSKAWQMRKAHSSWLRHNRVVHSKGEDHNPNLDGGGAQLVILNREKGNVFVPIEDPDMESAGKYRMKKVERFTSFPDYDDLPIG